MIAHPDAAVVARFRIALARGLGLSFDDSKQQQLAELLQRRVAADGGELDAYLDRLERGDDAEEHRQLAGELTVGETYFFRHSQQLKAFAELAVPERMQVRGSARSLRVLCAGCASGEEAYTLAILLLERAPAWSIVVRAVDVNPIALAKAARARYSPWALRETPQSMERRYFTGRGGEITLDASVRALVTFEERNLVREDPDLFAAGVYDAIFCRNVLMYFAPERAREVVARFTRALVPGGFLFLGHAETLRGLSNDYHLRHTHEAFYYQRKEGSSEVMPELVRAESAASDPGWSASSWIETVHRASYRIRVLSERSAEPQPSQAAVPLDGRGAALSLLAQERFGDALASLGEGAHDLETQLLRAVLLSHGGRASEAEEVCARLLEKDELNAGAHYVLALCRESAGDLRGAADHDSIAAYLDPAFAMPHLHLGLMARRAGDRETASRELEQASRLLLREDPSRLLLFGGGFGRDALIALCRTENGGRP